MGTLALVWIAQSQMACKTWSWVSAVGATPLTTALTSFCILTLGQKCPWDCTFHQGNSGKEFWLHRDLRRVMSKNRL